MYYTQYLYQRDINEDIDKIISLIQDGYERIIPTTFTQSNISDYQAAEELLEIASNLGNKYRIDPDVDTAVVFKEFFLDKKKYRRKTARTIARNVFDTAQDLDGIYDKRYLLFLDKKLYEDTLGKRIY